MINPKYLEEQNKLDIGVLDHQVDTFAQRRGIALTSAQKDLLRDAMLWMASYIADELVSQAAPDVERRWRKDEAAVYDAMTGFAKVENSWIDRTRAALGLPERDFKTLRDAIDAKCRSTAVAPDRD